MKKAATLAVIVMSVATAAHADIFVRWQSTSYMYQHDGSTWVQAGAICQLIWSLSDPSGNQARYNTVNYLAPGEYLLNGNTTLLYGRFDYRNPGMRFTNSDVGGNNINSGYLYSRIIENSSPDPNTYYWQSVITGPGLTVYDEMNPATEIAHVTAPNPPVTSTCNLPMVPEPGTMGLVLAGLGMIALRRFRRK